MRHTKTTEEKANPVGFLVCRKECVHILGRRIAHPNASRVPFLKSTSFRVDDWRCLEKDTCKRKNPLSSLLEDKKQANKMIYCNDIVSSLKRNGAEERLANQSHSGHTLLKG